MSVPARPDLTDVAQQGALVDVLDRLLEGGATVSGDVVLAVAGVDLVRVDLRLLVSAVETLEDGTR